MKMTVVPILATLALPWVSAALADDSALSAELLKALRAAEQLPGGRQVEIALTAYAIGFDCSLAEFTKGSPGYQLSKAESKQWEDDGNRLEFWEKQHNMLRNEALLNVVALSVMPPPPHDAATCKHQLSVLHDNVDELWRLYP